MLRKIFALTILTTFSLGLAGKAFASQPETEPERREMLHRILFAIYDKQGHTDEADAELTALSALKPNDPSFALMSGALFLKQKKYDLAQAKFDEVIKTDPNLAEGYAMKGQTFAAQKKYKDAVEQYTKANQHVKAGQNFAAQISVNKQLLDKQTEEKAYLDAISGKGKPKGK
jgi:predicted Zn-dependent protease